MDIEFLLPLACLIVAVASGVKDPLLKMRRGLVSRPLGLLKPTADAAVSNGRRAIVKYVSCRAVYASF